MTDKQREILQEIQTTLWNLYSSDDDLYGKSAEMACTVHYPNFWDCETVEDAFVAEGLTVYSYCYGPHRRHHFWRDGSERHDGGIWYSRDPFVTALRVVRGWAKEEMSSREEPCA